jgi:hypothetical protein
MQRKIIKKHESNTMFFHRDDEGLGDQRTIKERHENTNKKLKSLINKNSSISNNHTGPNNIDLPDSSGVGLNKAMVQGSVIGGVHGDHGSDLFSPIQKKVPKFKQSRGSFTPSKTHNPYLLVPNSQKGTCMESK